MLSGTPDQQAAVRNFYQARALGTRLRQPNATADQQALGVLLNGTDAEKAAVREFYQLKKTGIEPGAGDDLGGDPAMGAPAPTPAGGLAGLITRGTNALRGVLGGGEANTNANAWARPQPGMSATNAVGPEPAPGPLASKPGTAPTPGVGRRRG